MIDYGRGRFLIRQPLTITLLKKTGEGAYTSYTVERVLQREVTHEDVAHGEATLDGLSTVFHLWAAELVHLPSGYRAPALGDKVVFLLTTPASIGGPTVGSLGPPGAAGATQERWTIRSVTPQAHRQRYRVVAKLDQ